MKIEIPEKLKALEKIFKRNGHSLYLVGGAVRDSVLSIPNHDHDLTSDAKPSEVKAIFHKTIDTGIKHGTVTILFKGESFEVTTFRTEGDYKDNRHPNSVSFVRNLDEDLKRRDFTINALAADIETGEIIDRHAGLADIEKRVIRAIGDPTERFSEDALRMLRACRFASKLDFDIEEKTLEAIKELKNNVSFVSKERIREELFKLIDGKNPIKGLELMRVSGLLELILPELNDLYGLPQRGYHTEDVYTHSLLALDKARREGYSPTVKLAALFHDVGKKETIAIKEERNTFIGHEIAGERITEGILKRLKASNSEIYDVSHLVREHMFSYLPSWSDAAVRRFINRVGKDYLEPLFSLRVCDEAATIGSIPDGGERIKELKERIERELSSNNALTIKDLKINGNTLQEIGIPKGREMGELLSALLARVIEDPLLNSEETLKDLALQLYQHRGQGEPL